MNSSMALFNNIYKTLHKLTLVVSYLNCCGKVDDSMLTSDPTTSGQKHLT